MIGHLNDPFDKEVEEMKEILSEPISPIKQLRGLESIVRNNLMQSSVYRPYCGNMVARPPINNGCDNPRTVWNGEQFVCPKCGWTSQFPDEFIQQYKSKHKL